MIKIAQTEERKQTLFKTPKYKYLAELITFKSVKGAETSVSKAEKIFKKAKTKEKKLRVVRSIQYAENRIHGSLAKKGLKAETKKRFKAIKKTYGDSADYLWDEYRELK